MRKAVKTKLVSENANFMIRNIPDEIYHKLISKYYGNFTGKYKLETISQEDPNIKDTLEKLLEYLKTDIHAPIPKDSQLKVTIGIYTRTASTYIDPPLDNCALRVLFNLGYDEVYKLNPKYKVVDDKGQIKREDSGLNERYIFLERNKYIILGPAKNSKYQLEVSHEPTIVLPRQLPGEKEITKIRPRDYRRITIIFDYILPQELMDSLLNISKDMPNIKIKPGTSQKNIDEQIKRVKQNFASKQTQPELQVEQVSPESPEPTENFDLDVLNNMKQEEQDEILKLMNDMKL